MSVISKCEGEVLTITDAALAMRCSKTHSKMCFKVGWRMRRGCRVFASSVVCSFGASR